MSYKKNQRARVRKVWGAAGAAPPPAGDKILLESGGTDGILLEDGSGDILLEA